MGLDLLEKGQLSEEEFSGLVKAEEGFQKVGVCVGSRLRFRKIAPCASVFFFFGCF